MVEDMRSNVTATILHVTAYTLQVDTALGSFKKIEINETIASV